MLYLLSDSSKPMRYVSSGNLLSSGGFIHERRNIDTFVLIVVVKGELSIAQRNIERSLKEGEFMILFPHLIHFGTHPSEGELSYFWTHFYVTDSDYKIYNKGAMLRNNELYTLDAEFTSTIPVDAYLLPEVGQLSAERRSLPIFAQLLDLAKRENFNATWRLHYTLSSLLLEISSEAYDYERYRSSEMPRILIEITEYIRLHYNDPLTVDFLARRFNYSATYLTKLFKRYTGYSLLNYINRTRIAIAKNLLCSTTDSLSIIAGSCGFSSDKYFMRIFKQFEGTTPSQYRRSISRRKIVTQ